MHVLVFFLLMPSPAGTGSGGEGDCWMGKEKGIGRVRDRSETWCFPRLHSGTYTSPLVSDFHTNLCTILPRFQITILTKCYPRNGCEVKIQGAFTKSATAFNSFAHLSDFTLLSSSPWGIFPMRWWCWTLYFWETAKVKRFSIPFFFRKVKCIRPPYSHILSDKMGLHISPWLLCICL